ncbi:MAG: RES family NAD+ phosphorylase [Gammaproteobacteria bacterium]
MAKLPRAPDPDRPRSITPALRELTDAQLWHRIYRRGGEHPTRWDALRYFGPTGARFDHHLLDDDGKPHTQDRGIIYLAGDIPTCLAEVFQNNREVDRQDRRPWLASLRFESTLVLLDLTDTFPVQAGGSMKLVSGARLYAQNWARGFYEAYAGIDGLYFHSSMTNRPVLALFERVLTKRPFPATPKFHRSLADPLLLIPIQEACVDIGYKLSPDTAF